METPQEHAGDAMDNNASSSEPWDCWINEEFQLDSDLPLDISNPSWDDLAQINDSVARNLFACAPQQHTKARSPFEENDSPQTSNSRHEQAFVPEGMLRLLADEHANSSPCLSDSFEGCDGSFVNACEDVPSSSNSMWFMLNEESLSSSPHDEVEQAAECWMSGCFNVTDVNRFHHQGSINAAVRKMLPAKDQGPGPACRSRFVKMAARPPSQKLLGSLHGSITKKFAAPRGKQTSRPTLAQSISNTQVMEASPKPIVYPFALVKPCGIQGDTTLKDINQRINMASTVESPSGPSNTPPPPISSPFSGKPILAVTKIHTEGKGTITIMRTRS